MSSSSHPEVLKNLRHNFTVNVLDATFFGGGMGFTSTTTVLPLFLSSLTESTTLIALIGSIGLVGWRLPQLLAARKVARLPMYRSHTLWVSLHERIPFFFLALVGMSVTVISPVLAVILAFLIFGWHAIGGGLTATPWQSLMGRIIPEKIRGTFYGVQSAGFTALQSVCAFLAGFILTDVTYPVNFAACFFLTGMMTLISWIFLSLTREPDMPPPPPAGEVSFRRELLVLLRRDGRFRWYLMAQGLAQIAAMGAGFYTIYAVRRFNLQPDTLGLLTSLMLVVGAFANAAGGWLGDKVGHALMFGLGVLMYGGANFVALTAPNADWLIFTFIMAGAAASLLFTSNLAITLTFGESHERPLYIGLANTLVAPFTLFAPILGGLLVDALDFPVMFAFTLVCVVISIAFAFQMRVTKWDVPGDGAVS